MAKIRLKLFVTGKTPRSERAITNLLSIIDDQFKGQYELSVIDVLEHPETAEEEKILATPALIKELPPPLRRIIGDLSDREKVLMGLNIEKVSNNNVNGGERNVEQE